jgi:hypothetical protein
MERLEELIGLPTSLARADTDTERGNLDVLSHGQAAERAAVLERPHQAVPTASIGPPARYVAALELDAPGVGKVETRKDVDERGLARAVRPDKTHDFVTVELERDVPKRLNALERARDAGGPERCFGPPYLFRLRLRQTPRSSERPSP